jgi:hypothetical protein
MPPFSHVDFNLFFNHKDNPDEQKATKANERVKHFQYLIEIEINILLVC